MSKAGDFLDQLAPNPRTATGFLGTAYLLAYAAVAVPYGMVFRRAETREWERRRDANARWGRAVLEEQRKVEDEILARDGTRGLKTPEDCERYNAAGRHLRPEDFL